MTQRDAKLSRPHDGQKVRHTVNRYTILAPIYDFVSFEWPIYRPGRVAAIDSLRLRPGLTVLVVGCGTGLSMPLLAHRLGGSGHIVGVDLSPDMLRTAGRHRRLPTDQTLIQSDATHLKASDLPADLGPIDAVLFAYSLSLMDPWRSAWSATTTLLGSGTRIAIADMARPRRGGPLARAGARALTAAGGSDIDAHPWQALEQTCTDVRSETFWGGHVRVYSGVWPGQ